MADIRKNVVIAMVGANGTGKTTITKDIVTDWRISRPNQLVIGFDQHHQFGNLIDFYINASDKDWAYNIWKNPKCRNCLLILDDYKALVPNYVPTHGMREIFIDRRHYNIDVIFSCHSPGNVIPMLVDFTTHYFIFHTKNTEGKFKEQLPNSELCIAAARSVNKYTSLYGLGKHPNSPELWTQKYPGQKFPYVIVDVEQQKLKAVDMHNKLVF